MNPANWNYNQVAAAGKHALSYAAGIITAVAAIGLISHGDATNLTTGIQQISDGISSIVKGVSLIASVVIPIYTSLRAANNASPSSQIKSVANTLAQPQTVQDVNAVSDPESRKLLIATVATKMPEVKGVVADKAVADAIPSDKVVATAAELPAAAKAA